MGQKIVTINGRNYDAHTGMPISGAAEPQAATPKAIPARAHTPHSHLHQTAQKSHTLNRRIVKKEISPAKPTHHPVKKSPLVTKFAAHPSGFTHHLAPAKAADISPARQHPMVAKATHQIQQQKAAVSLKPSQVIKQEAIKNALEKAPAKHEKNDIKPKQRSKFARFSSVASASLAFLLLAGYFTYLNMPNLSVRVAAAQAGIDASYPEYKPDGYSLNGPIAYNQGQVSMKFAANAGPQSYAVDQAKSSWDSSAVLDNYVKKKVGENYIIYNERGLTIYTFDGNAAWVNGGILYTISGDAPLSSDQIRRIATSM